MKSLTNPHGLPIEQFDALRTSMANDRARFYKEFAVPFFGANRPGAKVSQALLDQFFLWSMQGGLTNSYESVKSWSTAICLRSASKPNGKLHKRELNPP